MSKGSRSFRRQANPTAMIFRLSFVHGLYVLPGWFIIKNFAVDSLSGMLGAFFSAMILLAVFQIRLKRRINGKTETMVNDALAMYPKGIESGEEKTGVSIRQSFSFSDYQSMNREVMFSYLRPWMTVLSGLAFLGVTVYAFLLHLDPVRLVLALMLTAYFLGLPWLLFSFRVKRAYKVGSKALTEQEITFSKSLLTVQAGGSERRITALSDIGITRNYLLLFIAGSNYVQIRRDACGKNDEMRILAFAGRLVEPA